MRFNRFEGPDFLKKPLFQKFAVALCNFFFLKNFNSAFNLACAVLHLELIRDIIYLPTYLMACAGSSEIFLQFSKITLLPS